MENKEAVQSCIVYSYPVVEDSLAPSAQQPVLPERKGTHKLSLILSNRITSLTGPGSQGRVMYACGVTRCLRRSSDEPREKRIERWRSYGWSSGQSFASSTLPRRIAIKLVEET